MIRNSRGFTLLELLVVVAIISILSAIASASLLNARINGNEASAIGSMRAIVSAEFDFYALHRGYAATLARLSSPCPNSQIGFVSSDLNANGVIKNGFRFSVASGAGGVAGPNDCDGNPTQSAFYATATPLSVGVTAHRGFAANQNGPIWQDTSGGVPPEPFTIGGTISPLGQ